MVRNYEIIHIYCYGHVLFANPRYFFIARLAQSNHPSPATLLFFAPIKSCVMFMCFFFGLGTDDIGLTICNMLMPLTSKKWQPMKFARGTLQRHGMGIVSIFLIVHLSFVSATSRAHLMVVHVICSLFLWCQRHLPLPMKNQWALMSCVTTTWVKAPRKNIAVCGRHADMDMD